MDDDTRAAVKDALVREAIAVGVLVAVLWVMGPGRILIPAWLARGRALLAGSDPHEGAIRQFAREVSEWEHSQWIPQVDPRVYPESRSERRARERSAQADRKPAAGGCGCGG